MRKAHSYEEPAFDVYQLKPKPGPGGEGRVGNLPTAVALRDLAATIRQKLPAGPTQVVGDVDRQVKRVAIACGAAGEFLADGVKAKADVFLTGEMRLPRFPERRSPGNCARAAGALRDGAAGGRGTGGAVAGAVFGN